MAEPTLRIVTADAAGVRRMIGWAADEGWNPGLHDAACFGAADPGGFLLAHLGEVPVAAISAVRYGTALGFIGLYLVPPAHRGRGFGWSIWQAAMAGLGARPVGLDGVVAQQANYRRSGFEFAWTTVRMRGCGTAPVPADPRLVPVASLPAGALAALERAGFGTARPTFLDAWLAQPDGVALAYVRDGAVAGYGVLRRCLEGCKVGPLFADDASVADALLGALAARAGPGTPVFLDVPQGLGEVEALAVRHGMTPVFETARMYRGTPPPIDRRRVFGITSFELG